MSNDEDFDPRLKEYYAAADALVSATRELKTAVAVVARWAPSIAKWREGDMVRSGASPPPLECFPSGTRLIELYSAYAAARAKLDRVFGLFAGEHRMVLKSPAEIDDAAATQ